MPTSDTTRPVPSSADGSYTQPETVQSRIAEKMRRMPKVDHNGHELIAPTADPAVTPILDPVPPQTGKLRPNPLQGGGEGVSVAAPARGGTLEQLAARLADGDEPPIPAAYTPASPR